ncbi:hypothetical protein AB0J86_15465 [Micromonospora sp. NPDC049559]|uniref:hypothetical protein n=1 Tax=Micromonospora sp. NPDC049559 TaxID=3155923 RepID=UPI00342C24EF
MTPVYEPDPSGGQVVITRFECPSRWVLLRLVVLHVRIKRAVQRRLPELIGSRMVVGWRTNTLLSISVWPDLDSMYGMGSVPQHVTGARVPSRLGVVTTCGVFTFTGDWRKIMFGAPVPARSPLWSSDGDVAK